MQKPLPSPPSSPCVSLKLKCAIMLVKLSWRLVCSCDPGRTLRHVHHPSGYGAGKSYRKRRWKLNSGFRQLKGEDAGSPGGGSSGLMPWGKQVLWVLGTQLPSFCCPSQTCKLTSYILCSICSYKKWNYGEGCLFQYGGGAEGRRGGRRSRQQPCPSDEA